MIQEIDPSTLTAEAFAKIMTVPIYPSYPANPVPIDYVPTEKEIRQGWLLTPKTIYNRKMYWETAIMTAFDVENAKDPNSIFYMSEHKRCIEINAVRLATAAEEAKAKYSPEECLEHAAKYWDIWRLNAACRKVRKTDMLYANADGSLYTGSAYITYEEKGEKREKGGKDDIQVFTLNKYGRAELINGKLMVRVSFRILNPETENLQMAALQFQDKMYWAAFRYEDSFYIDPETLDLYEYQDGLEYIKKAKEWNAYSLAYEGVY